MAEAPEYLAIVKEKNIRIASAAVYILSDH